MKEPIEVLFDTCKEFLTPELKKGEVMLEKFKEELGGDPVVKAICEAMIAYAKQNDYVSADEVLRQQSYEESDSLQ